jgi:hypothetical protein
MDATYRTPETANRWQRYFLLGLVLLFVGLSVQYTIKITCSERDNRSAFLRWREQILDLGTGVNIYDEHNYPNPPIMALMLGPLASLPPLPGSLLWFYLKVAMTFLVFYWVFRLVEDLGRPLPVWAKAVAMLLSLRPIMGDLTHGNVNIFIMFLVVGALYAYRHRRDLTAGMVLALAIACKVTPALFVPYFLWKRAWAALAGTVAGLVLFWWLLPGLFLGHNHNLFLLQEWVDQMIVPYVVEGEVTTEHQNQSLPGFVYRFTTDGPSFSVYDYNLPGYVPVEYHNVVSLDPEIPRFFLKLCMLVFAGVVVWACRAPTRDRRSWRLAAEYSIILVGMLIFSERTWKHHCVTLVVPFTLLVYGLAAVNLTAALRRYIIGTLVAVVLLMSLTSSGLFGNDADGLAKMAQVFGAYVWAHLLLLIALVVLLRRGEVAAAGSVPPELRSSLHVAPACGLQPPHSRALRSSGNSPTVTANPCSHGQRNSSHDQQTESLRQSRDSRDGPGAHPRGDRS